MPPICSRLLLPLLLAISVPAVVREAAGQTSSGSAIEALPDSMLRRIADEVTVPEGFALSVFAGPPDLTYPTCLHPAGQGVVFVCTDPNLLFGRERFRGRILRLVDEDGDGVADRYTIFADSLDGVRGITFDGESVYVMHAPTLAAYRDLDGDGVADEKRVLVEGLGFGLDDRNGDHSSNGIRLGIDGWIYVAVGDYGFLEATGRDGKQLRLHAGGVVRVRPDGGGLELVARGTRNIYDIAVDGELRLFARDNTNNGQGWNSRFHYLPAGADAGYPSRFRNFPEEIHEPLADFGAGAATTTLWVEDPALSAAIEHPLLSADWALNRVYAHALTPRGASFGVTQEELMTIPRPVDLEVDPAGNLFVASLSGGSYDYAGEHVGYVVRLRPLSAPPAPPPAVDLGEPALVEAILSPSAMRRLEAQRVLLARGGSPAAVRRLEQAILDPRLSAHPRIAALFTLQQLRGVEAHDVIERASADPAVRALALRALADRGGELSPESEAILERSLTDPDPFVQLQAVTGLARTGMPTAAAQLMGAAISEDPTVAHVARNALAAVGAAGVDVALRALDSGDEPQRAAALSVLGRLHSPRVVGELVERVAAPEPAVRLAISGALARLHHREGPWGGEWWGNQPGTEGPYFHPVRWEASERIRSVLVDVAGRTTGDDLARLLTMLEREGLVPRESGTLLGTMERLTAADRQAILDLLIGGRELRPEALPRLAALASEDPSVRRGWVQIAAALPSPPPEALEPLRSAATDASLPVELRASALTAITRIAPSPPPPARLGAFAAVLPTLAGEPVLLQAWRRFVIDRERVAELDHLVAIARSGGPDERVVAYATLAQIAGIARNPAEARARAAAAVEAAWGDHSAVEALVRAIQLLGVEDRYEEELARYHGKR